MKEQSKLKSSSNCRKHAHFEEPTSISDEQVLNLSKPRKMIKKNAQRLPKNSAAISYSKIPEIPEVKLTVEDMKKDPIELIVGLQRKYQEFGAVKLTVPTQWKSPFCFNFGQIGITTRIQQLHKLKLGKITQAFKQKQDAYNVRNFQHMAEEFERTYRFKTKTEGNSRQQKVESEYWNLVKGNYDGPDWKFKTTVEYAADLPVTKHGSGFPLHESHKSKDENFDYHSSLFNLNNIYKSPTSILKIADERKQYISGVTTPWVYMGMMFSSFCWHVEDLWINSMNYSHKGETKTWYVIPRKYKETFDQYVKVKTGCEDLLDRITFMLDPLELIRNGIPVYKANQRPGDYVCTFFKAYHAGFSHGFNVGEAVNFASPLSLEFMQESMKYIQDGKQKKPSVLSYEWLVYENKVHHSMKAHKSLSNYIGEEYREIVKHQFDWIENIYKNYELKVGQEISDLCKYDRNSCSKCKNYQYLSSIRCVDCNKNYCPLDFTVCCKGQYELVYRKLNQDRKKILTLFKKNLKRN